MKTMKRFGAFLVALVMMFTLFAVGASAWAADDGIEVFWNGTSVGSVKYDEMQTAIKDTADVTYSTLKEENGSLSTTTGKVYTFDQLLAKVGKTEDWSKAGDDTTVVMSTPGYNKTYNFTKTALTETRNAYNSDGTVIGAVPAGFLPKTKDGVTTFQFIYGQTDVKDTNQTQFLKFDGAGLSKIDITATAAPAEDETQADGIEVFWNDKSVGTVSYDEMVDGISQATKKYKYSTVNSTGTYSSFEVPIYPFTQLMEAVKKDKDWEAASDLTKVVFKDSGYETELTKATLTEERYFFDDAGVQADTTKPGFKITESNKGDYLQFVFGQKDKNEQTNGKFFKFKEPAALYINVPDVEVIAPDGTSKGFSYNDLDTFWKEEGSKKYTYTNSNTFPTYGSEELYGPTVKTVLAKAGIDLDALGDNDVVRFDAADNRGLDVTVKEIKRTRYAFPNGKSTNDYKGTTEAQLTGKYEVPYILSIKNGKTNIRSAFGQVDPQEQNLSYYIKYINKITVTKDGAKEYTGLKPTIADGSKVKKGDKLNFDLELPAGVYEGAIHYTVSTDGTEPADPTLGSTMYNWAQNRTDDQDYLDPEKAELYNIYEFTDAPKTIVKVKAYVSGYLEPKAMTLTYTKAEEAPVTKLNGLAKDASGVWAMYKDDKVDTTYNGLAKSDYNDKWYSVKNGYIAWDYTGFDQNLETKKWYRVVEGRVDFNAQSIYKKPENGVWYKTTNGRVTFNETGVFKNVNGWWRVENSRVNFKADGIYKNENGWWKTSGGKVTFKENGVFKNENGWWYVKGSKVDFSYNGLAKNKNGTWKIKNGKVDFGFSGTYQGKTIKNGKVQ